MAIERKKISDLVLEDFENKIRSGILKKGDKLPNETEYAKQLGVSRLSLREAIHSLRTMGAVVQKPKVGTVIICDNPDLWIRTPPNDILHDAKALHDLTEVRLLFEPMVVRLSAKNASKKTIQKLRDLVVKQVALSKKLNTKEDYEAYTDVDMQFHMMITRASGNAFLAQMYASVLQSTKDFILQSFLTIPSTIANANRMHMLICDAIEERDADAAGQLMEAHIRSAAQQALDAVDSESEAAACAAN